MPKYAIFCECYFIVISDLFGCVMHFLFLFFVCLFYACFQNIFEFSDSIFQVHFCSCKVFLLFLLERKL